jgi:hypothetical protein
MASRPTTCHEHDMAILTLQNKMEVLERHHNFYKEKFSGIELMLEELKYFSINTNNSIERFKDIPDRMRKQEDKAIIYDLIKVGCGIILGLLITNYVSDRFLAPREEYNYKIERK